MEERAALATVVATRRSAPRPVGSKLVVFESGRLHGSVSGGCVESDVAEQAKEVIAGGEPRLLTYGITDDQAWGIGLPCGGEIDVFIQRLEGELPQDGDDAKAKDAAKTAEKDKVAKAEDTKKLPAPELALALGLRAGTVLG